jgi:hypothetical protein
MECAMDPLAAIFFAAPAAASNAVGAASEAVGAVARPFADVFSALASPATSSDEGADESAAVHDRIAERLQEILEAAGADSGECATVTFDSTTGDVDVSHCPSAREDAAAAIAQDEQLMDDLRQLAALDAADDERVELLIQVA